MRYPGVRIPVYTLFQIFWQFLDQVHIWGRYNHPAVPQTVYRLLFHGGAQRVSDHKHNHIPSRSTGSEPTLQTPTFQSSLFPCIPQMGHTKTLREIVELCSCRDAVMRLAPQRRIDICRRPCICSEYPLTFQYLSCGVVPTDKI